MEVEGLILEKPTFLWCLIQSNSDLPEVIKFNLENHYKVLMEQGPLWFDPQELLTI